MRYEHNTIISDAYSVLPVSYGLKQDKKAVLSQGNCAITAAVLIGLTFADNIHYKLKCSQVSKL